MLKHLKPLIKDSIIYALGNISGKVVGFILLPFYVDKLSTAEYGMLGTLEATSQLIVALAALHLHTAFTRWYWDKELINRRESTFFTLLTSIFTIALVLNIFAFPFAKNISFFLFDSFDFSRLIRLMMAAAGLELISTVPPALCRLQNKPVMYTRNMIIRLSIVLALTILFVAFLDRKLEGIYEAQIIGSLAYLVLFIPYISKNIKIHFEKKILAKMIHYSFPLMLSSSFGVMLGVSDRFSLNFISGLTSVGIYSLGYKLANTLKIFIVMSVNLALGPVIFKMADKAEAKRFYSKIMTYFTFGLMFFVLGLCIFGQEIVKVLTSKEPEYWGAYTVIPFISFGIVFGMMKDQASYSLQIAKRTGIVASVTIFVSLLNIGLNVLLIPYWGAAGAAVSTLLSQIIYFFIMLYYAQRHYAVAYEYRKVFGSIIAGSILCLIAWLSGCWPLGWRLLFKTILFASYPFILYLFGFYDPAELSALKGFWKKWKNPQQWKQNIQTMKS